MKSTAVLPAARTWTAFIDFYVTEHVLANKLRWDWTFKHKMRKIREQWADRPVESISVAEVQKYLNELHRRGCAPATARYICSIIRHMLRFAARMQSIEQSPLPRTASRCRRYGMSAQEGFWKTRRRACGQSLRRWRKNPPVTRYRRGGVLLGAVTMTLDTGLRRGSILALTFGMVKWDHGAHGMLDVPAEILKQRRPSS